LIIYYTFGDLKRRYRKINWKTKTYRQRSEDKFLNNIENNIENNFDEKNDIVICIGVWSNKLLLPFLIFIL
jgi:hypothetical protein